MKRWRTERLLARYRELACERGQYLERSEVGRANRIFDRLARIEAELRTRGQAYEDGVRAMLTDEDGFVRLRACSDVLAFAPDEALPVLRELAAAQTRSWAAHNAKMLLEVWESGEWKPWPA